MRERERAWKGERKWGRECESEREGEREISTVRMRDMLSAMTPNWKAFLLANRSLNLPLAYRFSKTKMEWKQRGGGSILRLELKVIPLQPAFFNILEKR